MVGFFTEQLPFSLQWKLDLRKGAFNNYVDQNLSNFRPPPPLEWTSMDIIQTHPPCPRGQKVDKSPLPPKI